MKYRQKIFLLSRGPSVLRVSRRGPQSIKRLGTTGPNTPTQSTFFDFVSKSFLRLGRHHGLTALPQWEINVQGRRQKIFQRGAIKIEPVLTTKNGRIFEIWEINERVCENPGGPWHLPASPCRRPCKR